MPQTLVVHCNNAKEAKALNDLLLSMAGYIEADDDYDELYPDESDKLEINNNLLYDIMSRHAGHNVSITNYGAGANMTLECNDCNCVLFDTDVYDLIGVV